ncbi:MAG: YkvA family protein, partial [Thermodesulfobacteriota bacterium]
ICMKYLVLEGASMIRPEDVKDAREKAEEWFRGRSKDSPPELISELRRLYGMICDHLSGSSIDYPFRTISLAAFGILYVVNPMDLIPDPIKRVGYLDDSVMLRWVAEAIGELSNKPGMHA